MHLIRGRHQSVNWRTSTFNHTFSRTNRGCDCYRAARRDGRHPRRRSRARRGEAPSTLRGSSASPCSALRPQRRRCHTQCRRATVAVNDDDSDAATNDDDDDDARARALPSSPLHDHERHGQRAPEQAARLLPVQRTRRRAHACVCSSVRLCALCARVCVCVCLRVRVCVCVFVAQPNKQNKTTRTPQADKTRPPKFVNSAKYPRPIAAIQPKKNRTIIIQKSVSR